MRHRDVALVDVVQLGRQVTGVLGRIQPLRRTEQPGADQRQRAQAGESRHDLCRPAPDSEQMEEALKACNRPATRLQPGLWHDERDREGAEDRDTDDQRRREEDGARVVAARVSRLLGVESGHLDAGEAKQHAREEHEADAPRFGARRVEWDCDVASGDQPVAPEAGSTPPRGAAFR